MSEAVKLAFASCSEDLIPSLLDEVDAFFPGVPLYVVSEFPPERGRWIPYHPARTFGQNLALVRDALRGRHIRLAGVLLQPRMPYWRMRLIPFVLAPLRTLIYNENLHHFMLRPRSLRVMLRHGVWRLRNLVKWELSPGGATYTLLWRLAHPRAFRRPLLALAARAAGMAAAMLKALRTRQPVVMPERDLAAGISVVIPSRNGRELLTRLLPGLVAELAGVDSEVMVVDNGSDDGTAAWLAAAYPRVALLSSAEPLSFARAMNLGINNARYSRVCLLNNDMTLQPGFFAPLLEAFGSVPGLFCATAQILFPEGERRQETGKAVMTPLDRRPVKDFPIRCELPVEGENLSYVLYGSGGCSMYDTRKALALGGFDEIYAPAYVEDLDFGFRGWQQGWPSVFVAPAKVVHRHRATTSRYYSERQLAHVLERNYLRFLVRAISSPALFRTLWRNAIDRLNRIAAAEHFPDLTGLRSAAGGPLWARRPGVTGMPDELILALGSGDVAVFPGGPPRGRDVVLVASPYVPFPLSHGGAVRMYNLMRRAARDFDQVLVTFADELSTPPREMLELCCEIVMVRRVGSHARPLTERPDVVEEFDVPSFHAALRQTVRKWHPPVAQLEFTQLAQYAPDCAPAKTVLVEHDVTLDLYEQLARDRDDWETRQQLARWRAFERRAWRQFDAVVTMSQKDCETVRGTRTCVVVPNGVDLERFQPSEVEPEPRRILFIGSFAHLPNVMAVAWFLDHVWLRLDARLHVIAGTRHKYFLDRNRDRIGVNLDQPGIEVEDFVADVRPAYRRAAVVVAPLLASAGTNIKIMEAMAMGKAVVSTPGGVNGLDVTPGRDFLLARTAEEMASAITDLFRKPERRREIERRARATAEEKYDWDTIAREQKRLYDSL